MSTKTKVFDSSVVGKAIPGLSEWKGIVEEIVKLYFKLTPEQINYLRDRIKEESALRSAAAEAKADRG